MGPARLATLFLARDRSSLIETNRRRSERFSARAFSRTEFVRAAARGGDRLVIGKSAAISRDRVAGSAAPREYQSTSRSLSPDVEQRVVAQSGVATHSRRTRCQSSRPCLALYRATNGRRF